MNPDKLFVIALSSMKNARAMLASLQDFNEYNAYLVPITLECVSNQALICAACIEAALNRSFLGRKSRDSLIFAIGHAGTLSGSADKWRNDPRVFTRLDELKELADATLSYIENAMKARTIALWGGMEDCEEC